MVDFRSGQVPRAAAFNSIAQPGVEHIQTNNLASDKWFRDIPQDFRHLQLRLYGGIDGSSSELAMRFNDDGNSVYYWWRSARRDNNTWNEGSGNPQTAIRVCHWGSVSSRNHCIIDVHDYSSSHWQGAFCRYGATGVDDGSGTGVREVGDVFGHRNAAEPVNAVGFFVVGGSNDVSPQTVGSLYLYR